MLITIKTLKPNTHDYLGILIFIFIVIILIIIFNLIIF